jgi:hypothetical protein
VNGLSECFRIAGRPIRVDWEDAGLQALLRPALAHRRVAPVAPELVITVARRPPSVRSSEARGWVMHDDPAGLVIEETEKTLSHHLDLAAGRARFECGEPARLSPHERAAPFRLILQRWLRTRGVQLLHAGAVGLPGGSAVLLAAPSGGGKSNTVLSCLAHSPLHLLGEDFVAVDEATPPRVWSLYGSAKLHAADVARFPVLAGASEHGRDETDGKVAFVLAETHAPRWADALPVRAILHLKITGDAATRLAPAAPGEAVRALLTSLLMVLPSARRPLLEFTTQLARKLPAYRLELGRDPRQIATAIQDFLQSPP